MDTELLKTFLEVQRTRHFGKAAENLFLTQSAVSFRIRQLEQHLGVTLFSRHRNNIQLTTAGERLLPHAESMMLTLQRARQDVAVPADHQQLVIAATATLWDSYLMPAFLSMQQQLPNISWRAESLERESIIRGLSERQLDLAILFDPPNSDDLLVTHLTELQLVPVIHADSPATKEALQANYILMDWGTAFQMKQAGIVHEDTRVTVRTNHAGIALASVLQQRGAAYLPKSMIQGHLDSGRLRQIDTMPVLRRSLSVAYLKQAEENEGVQLVLTQLQQLMA